MVKETLSNIEKKVLLAISGKEVVTAPDIEELAGLSEVESMRALQWLNSKGLIEMSEDRVKFVRLKDPNFVFLERDVLRKIAEKKQPVATLDEIGVQWIMQRKWGEIKKGELVITDDGKQALKEITEDEKLFVKLKGSGEVALAELDEEEGKGLELLKRRPKVVEILDRAEREVKITGEGQKIADSGLKIEEEHTQLTHDMIMKGTWKDAKFREYDLGAPVPPVYPAKMHPLNMFIDRIREIFLEMGFEEREGPLIESSFWNFDALFQPQDHPARDLADTFYLEKPGKAEVPQKHVKKVKGMHEHGGDIDSLGWGYNWSLEQAGKPVLRTHTTAVTVRSLADIQPPAKVFSIGRVFRNETIDYKHLAEFHQVDGIVVDEKVSFRDLLGYLKEFYKKMGFEKVRFRPGYFPYTEMSVEPEVYFEDRKEWVELGGAGIFRPEVTKPFGIDCPVLAWGLGIERIVLLTLGIEDLRTIYGNDLGWLRKVPQIY